MNSLDALSHYHSDFGSIRSNIKMNVMLMIKAWQNWTCLCSSNSSFSVYYFRECCSITGNKQIKNNLRCLVFKKDLNDSFCNPRNENVVGIYKKLLSVYFEHNCDGLFYIEEEDFLGS